MYGSRTSYEIITSVTLQDCSRTNCCITRCQCYNPIRWSKWVSTVYKTELTIQSIAYNCMKDKNIRTLFSLGYTCVSCTPGKDVCCSEMLNLPMLFYQSCHKMTVHWLYWNSRTWSLMFSQSDATM